MAPVGPEGPDRCHYVATWSPVMAIRSMRRLVSWRLLWLAGVFAGCAGPAPAQQFSADIVGSHGDGTATSIATLRARDGKVRIEAAEFPDGFFLSNSASRVSYFARPRARI